MKSKGTWYGKPLEKYTKEELIDIVIQVAKELKDTREQHIKQRKTLFGYPIIEDEILPASLSDIKIKAQDWLSYMRFRLVKRRQ